MPRYDFSCSNGHTTERFSHISTDKIVCECGFVAKRQAVNKVSSLRSYGSQFVMPSDVRSAIDETMGYKAEATEALHEAVMNGLKVKD